MTINDGIAGMASTAAGVSFFCSLLILLTERWHGANSLDTDMTSAQKFHTRPVPRVGGLSLLFGLLAATTLAALDATAPAEAFHAGTTGILLACAMPAFFAGLTEDLTKRVSILARMLATFASPLLAAALINAVLPRVDVVGLDWLMQLLPFALVVTAIAVAGVTNAMNIVDGFNGLAGFTGIIILAALASVAWQAGDTLLLKLAIAGLGATLGFLLINYPTGRLFLGDGGAYLLGFWIAEIAVLLILRNPGVSAWQLLAICGYPVTEVLYSIYRKKIVRKMSPGVPDRLHFHMLVHRRFICYLFPAREPHQPWFRNASTTLAIVVFIAPFSLAAAAWGDTTPAALGLILLQTFCYLAIYARLVRGHWCLNPAVGLGFRSEHRQRGMP